MYSNIRLNNLYVIAITFIISFVSLVQIKYILVIYCLALPCIYLSKLNKYHLSYTHITFLLFTTYIIARTICNISITPIKSLDIIAKVSVMNIVFSLASICFQNTSNKRRFSNIVYVITIIFLLWCTISFVILKWDASSHGFNDIYHLRFLNRPWGYINNGYIIVAISLYVITIYHKRHNYGLLSLLTLCTLMSFSKGTYIAYIIFLVCLCLTKTLNTYRVIFTVFAITCIFYFIMTDELNSLVENMYTYTSSGSYHWRTNSLSFNRNIFSLLFGSGITSSSLYMESYESNTFTITSPNLFLQIFIELGIVGCILFFIMILSIIINYKRTVTNSILISYLSFILIKESCQGILMSYYYILFVFSITISFLDSSKKEISQSFYSSIKYLFISTALIGISSIVCGFIQFHLNSTRPQYSIENWDINKPDKYPIIIGVIQGVIPTYKIICDSMLIQNPYICIYRGIEFYNDNNYPEALDLISYSTLNQPSFLHSSILNKILSKDVTFANALRERLILKGVPTDNNPITMSKYGYILKYYDIPEANYWLQLAVNRMPSLSTPWLLLGDTHKFNFLTSVGATSYSTTCTTDLFAEFDLVNKLHNEYSCRFVHWYGYIPSYKNN